MKPAALTLIAILTAGFTPALAQDPLESNTVIKTETRVVLVDAVVTDKKGTYVRDLKQKDFHIWEDGKEQAVNSFSFSADGGPNKDRKQHFILFFDNTGAGAAPGNQIIARNAAKQFVSANAGPGKLMAIVEYTGVMRITQNFTDDPDRLQQVIGGVKFPVMGAGAGSGLSGASGAAYNTLAAVQSLARGLNTFPERKSLILFSAGIRINQDTSPQLAAAIDSCNRSNVAVYPIDIRGLMALPAGGDASSPGMNGRRPGGLGGGPPMGFLLPYAAGPLADLVPAFAALQTMAFQVKGPTTPSGGGSTPRAPTTPSTPSAPRAPSNPINNPSRNPSSGSGSTNNNINNANNVFNRQNNRMNSMRTIIPDTLGSQDGLYALANGTGGFVIVNTNDMLGGLTKIGQEQNEYYLLGYSPSKELEPGKCHTLRVKVDQSGSSVRYRTGYCDAKPLDVLSGTSTERDLESRMTSTTISSASATMQTPFYYIAPNTARVNITMEIPAAGVVFTKGKGGLMHASVPVLGIAKLPTGGTAARFSDTIPFDLADKKAVEAFQQTTIHYEKQIEIASGAYDVNVIFGLGKDSFGKLKAPLTVEAWNPQQFGVGSIALSKSILTGEAVASGLDSTILEGKVPMIVGNIQVVPTGSTTFKKSGPGFFYTEIYSPMLLQPIDEKPAEAKPADAKPAEAKPAEAKADDKPNAPKVETDPAKLRNIFGTRIVMADAKTGAIKYDTGLQRFDANVPPGSGTVPIGMKIPLDKVEPGTYKLYFQAVDAQNHQSARYTEVVVEN